MHLSNYLNIFIGGHYTGDSNWSRNSLEQDNCFKVYYLQEGEITIISNDLHYYTLTSGRLYLIVGYNISRCSAKDLFTVNWIHFQPYSLPMQSMLMGMSPTVIELDVNDNYDFLQLLESSNEIISCKTERVSQYMRLEAYLMLYITELIERYSLVIDRRVDNFSRVLSYIENNLDRSIRLDELAEVMCLAPSYFHRVFRITFGITPAAYINQLKMREAVKLLTTTSMSIKEIGFSLGYADDSHFSKAVRSFYNMTPKSLRQNRSQAAF